jgi:predicted DNA-binding transcriptional regulator AlpA
VESENRLMRRTDVMAYCRITNSTFYRWREQGIIPDPIPGTKRWDRQQVEAALDRASGINNGVPNDDFEARENRWNQNRPEATG